jgi:hypothetical protein
MGDDVMAVKLKNLVPAFSRIARLEKIVQDAYDKREAELKRIGSEGKRVALAAIKKAEWVRGETLLARRDRGWAIGIYQGTSIPYPPGAFGTKWSIRIHTCSILGNGKPGKAKGVEWVAVEDPSNVCDGYKIVGKVSPVKVARP